MKSFGNLCNHLGKNKPECFSRFEHNNETFEFKWDNYRMKLEQRRPFKSITQNPVATT